MTDVISQWLDTEPPDVSPPTVVSMPDPTSEKLPEPPQITAADISDVAPATSRGTPKVLSRRAGRPTHTEGRRGSRPRDKEAVPPKVPAALREIPAPGGRYRGGRGRHVALKVTGATTAMVLAVSAAFIGGMSIAEKIQVPPPLTITDTEAARWGLDEFPVQGAAAFAERYVSLCLSNPADGATSAARATQVRAMSTTGVSATCGVDGENYKAGAITFAGLRGTVPGRDSARYVAVQAALADGRVLELTVPVWTDPHEPGSSFMVVGSLGNEPLPAVAKVPGIPAVQADAKLSADLGETLFPEFFTAWGSSNTSVLARFAADDATPAVLTGLGNALGTPEVGNVSIALPAGESASHTWRDGDTTAAQVDVTWKGADSSLTLTYRVDLLHTASAWSVSDIHGGGVDTSGSTPDRPTDAVPSPSPSPSTDSH